MGYNTDFEGTLEFTSPLTLPQLDLLETILGEDRRGHPDWPVPKGADFYFVDLEIAEHHETKEKVGLKWNGAEKTYDMPGQINLILALLRAKFPDFGLKGGLTARGEGFDDHRQVVINSQTGLAEERYLILAEPEVECPKCHHKFNPA